VAVPIVEQIAQAILAALDVLKAAGTLSDAKRPLRTGIPVNPKDKLAVLYQDDPEEDAEQGSEGRGPVDRQSWIQPFMIDCYVRPSDTSTTAVDTTINMLRADVEKAMRLTPTWGGLAIDTRIRAPEGFLTGDESAEGVRVNIDVLYRTDEDDPYVQG